MLGKAATHIRPLLRLNQHAHQPDLFTSNPSLLHHFQPQGVSNAVAQVSGAQASSGASGAAGAGRSGFNGGGASSGAGYTGHARAFLSLPQGPGADASTGTSAEDTDSKAARQRAHLQLKQRIAGRREDTAPTTRIVTVRDRMSGREGSRRVRMIEMEDQAEQAQIAGSSKRSSIAYPAWAALPADATAGGALWVPGRAPRQMGARPFSTQARPALEDELVSRTPPPGTHALQQPNRVLMDLAGLDIARPNGRGQVRRNSTASLVRPNDKRADATPSQDQTADEAIYMALRRSLNDAKRANELVAHYRAPRGVPSALDAEHPLPAGYTTQTYNICLEVLLQHRKRGESIAPILDMYNEMLARDVVPNARTTSHVICALCLREEDVAAASRRWETSHSVATLKAEKLGIPISQTESDLAAARVIEAYQSEANLQSALNLFRVAFTFHPTINRSNADMIPNIVAAAAASAGLSYGPKLEDLMPVIEAGLKAGKEGRISPAFYGSVFEFLAPSAHEHIELIRTVWNSYSLTRPATAAEAAEPAAAEAAKRSRLDWEVCQAAIRAFTVVGDIETVKAIIASCTGTAYAQRRGETQARAFSAALMGAYAKAGDLDAALEVYKSQAGSNVILDIYDMAEALVQADRAEEAALLLKNLAEVVASEPTAWRVDRNRVLVIYVNALSRAVGKDADVPKALDDAMKIVAAMSPRFDAAVSRLHVDLLLAQGRFADVPRLLLRFGAYAYEDGTDLRAMLAAVAVSPAPLVEVLNTVRAIARLGQPIADANDTVPIGTLIVDKYLAARATVESLADLHLPLDSLFRLVEAVVAMPRAHIESGAADRAFEQVLADLAVQRENRGLPPNNLVTSTVVSELADILVERFGTERATAMLTSAFGDRAAALLPTPEGTVDAASEASFTLPPTPQSGDVPPSTLQPPSPHTLHIQPQLGVVVDKLQFALASTTPEGVYSHIRTALTKDNAVPPPDAIGRLMAALARAGDEPKVRELYSLAQVVLASCLPDSQQQAGGWRAVEDSMIASCCFLGHLEQAGMHRARIIDAGMVPTADAYATMIACSRDSTDDAHIARELFDEARSLGVIPNLYLYNTIISKLSKARKAEMALDLFNHMKAQRIRPSSVTYGAIINACCRVGDAESAATLFEEMSHQPNFKPRVPPFNTMMQFHLQTQPSRERVLYYYDAMRAAGVRPSAHTYKLLLDAYGTLAPIDLGAMDRVFNDLCADRKVGVQGTHWASLITALGMHAGDVDRAMAVFDGIPKHASSSTAVPEPVVWEAALNVLAQRGSLEQLEKLRARLAASGARSTAYVCNVLITGYAKHGELDQARAVFEGMGDSVTGVAAPNNHPALFTSSGHVKPATATSAPTDVVFREPSTYEAMMRAELAAGNRANAEAVLARMEERRYPVAVWMKARAILDEAV